MRRRSAVSGGVASPRKHVQLLVVIPAGPSCEARYLLDTLDSISKYTTPDRQVIIVDDSGRNLGADLRARVADLDVLTTTGDHGLGGRLHITLSSAYLHALRHYDFDILLKMDSDALVIGERPEEDAIRFSRNNPNIGEFGGYARGEYWGAHGLRRDSSYRTIFQNPRRYFLLQRVLRRARVHGFEPGDYVFGGAFFVTQECLHRLAEARLLGRKEFRHVCMAEDHLFGLLVKSVGLDLGEFAIGDLPMAMTWKSLPCSPEELVRKGKKITHSTRRWEQMDEAAIRSFFRGKRAQATPFG